MNENFQNENQPTPMASQPSVSQPEVQVPVTEPGISPQPHHRGLFSEDLVRVLAFGVILFFSLISPLLNWADSFGVNAKGMVLLLGGIVMFFLVPAALVVRFRWKKSRVFSWGAVSALLLGCLFVLGFLLMAGAAFRG